MDRKILEDRQRTALGDLQSLMQQRMIQTVKFGLVQFKTNASVKKQQVNFYVNLMQSGIGQIYNLFQLWKNMPALEDIELL